MSSKIGKVTINYDYCSGDDPRAEGETERKLLEIVKSGQDIEEVLLNETDGELLYHLSDIRKNLLAWYQFDKTSSVLEIGAECGALTGLFCEKAGRVVAVEQSKIRAEINAYRNDHDNLEIIVGRIGDIKLNEKFDVVTLIGSLECAGELLTSKDPFTDLIKIAKDSLKPGGQLIIATANKYGLKYWAGAAEEHSGVMFEGIQGYEGDSKARTFSRKELTDMITGAGLGDIEFYYPVPDHKMALEVISPEYLKNYHDMHGHTPAYDRDRLVLFNEAKATETLIKDGMYEDFANSFLVFAKKEG